jgi:C-terminal processing protease CtpA/Prc
VVVVVSERTSSAAEIFTAALKQHHRAKVIGTETCGCVLAVRMHHNLPDGGELAVSELDFRTAEGTRLEGEGIEPDTAVKQSRQNIYARRDSTLEFAYSSLRRSAHH